MTLELFNRIEEHIKDVPFAVKEKAKIYLMKSQLEGKAEGYQESLFVAYANIFQFILSEESREAEPDVLCDFVYLNILEFLQGVTYDKIFDDRAVDLLSLANILNREYLRVAAKLGIGL